MAIDFQDDDGNKWTAEVVSHGNTSAYLNQRVHRPIIQFDSLGKRRAARYLGLPEGFSSIEDIPPGQLVELLNLSSSH